MDTRKTVYQEFRHECYGGGGIFGHKVWVTVAEEPDKKALAVFLGKMIAKFKPAPCILNGRSFAANELTVFVYYGPQPESGKDDWTANKIITVPL